LYLGSWKKNMPSKSGIINKLVSNPSIRWAMNPFSLILLVLIVFAIILFSPKYDKFLDSIPSQRHQPKTQSENLTAPLPQL
jgi:hypothetical protein